MAVVVSLAGYLAACATAAPPPRQETDGQALQQLRSGEAVLDCTQACASAWHRNRAELTARYNQGAWRDLALLVMQIDYRQDLGYFYLGRAAEGLGDTSAALDYYKAAEALATGTDEEAKCAARSGDCNGLDLLSEVLTWTQIATAERHRRAWAARGRPGAGEPAGASAQAPAGAWVNPPPVTQ